MPFMFYVSRLPSPTALDLLKTLFRNGVNDDTCTVAPAGSRGFRLGYRDLFCFFLPDRLSVTMDPEGAGWQLPRT
jgi:hypothetical protein